MRTADEARELTDQIRVMANSIFGETSTVGAELDECAKDGYTRRVGSDVRVGDGTGRSVR
jgi:hypothetical protein